jgi:hypothetical protein
MGQLVPLHHGKKQWCFENAWTAGDRPEVAVALDVDVPGVMVGPLYKLNPDGPIAPESAWFHSQPLSIKCDDFLFSNFAAFKLNLYRYTTRLFRERYGITAVTGGGGVRGGGGAGGVGRRGGLVGILENGGRAFFELMGNGRGGGSVGGGGVGGGVGGGGVSGESVGVSGGGDGGGVRGGVGGGRFKNVLAGAALVGAGAAAGMLSVVMDKKQSRRW